MAAMSQTLKINRKPTEHKNSEKNFGGRRLTRPRPTTKLGLLGYRRGIPVALKAGKYPAYNRLEPYRSQRIAKGGRTIEVFAVCYRLDE